MKKIFLISILSLLPALAFAQATGGQGFVPLTNIPGLTEGISGTQDLLPTFLNRLYLICIGIAVVLTVLQLIRAGITYMTASGNIGSTEQAKHLIGASLLGLLLVLSPVIVFSVINPEILSLKINTADLKVDAPAQTQTEINKQNEINAEQKEARSATPGGTYSPQTYACAPHSADNTWDCSAAKQKCTDEVAKASPNATASARVVCDNYQGQMGNIDPNTDANSNKCPFPGELKGVRCTYTVPIP